MSYYNERNKEEKKLTALGLAFTGAIGLLVASVALPTACEIAKNQQSQVEAIERNIENIE